MAYDKQKILEQAKEMIGIKLTYLDITSDILALHLIIKENTSNAHESINVMLKDTIMSVLNKN